MKRAVAFIALVAPALAWVPVRVWIHTNVEAWEALRVSLSLPMIVVLTVDNWVMKWQVFAVIGSAITSPLLVLAASVLPSGDANEDRRDLLVWTVVTGIIWSVPMANRIIAPGTLFGTTHLFEWAGTMTYVCALGAAYSLFRQRRRDQPDALSPLHVLWWALAAAVVLGEAAVILPALIWLLTEARAPQNNEMKLTRSDA